MTRQPIAVETRNTRREDFPEIIALSRKVYPQSKPWRDDQLASHLRIFPEGQFVAVEKATGQVLGMAASLIILWDDYDLSGSWRDFTDQGMFTNHDPFRGRTLYGAEIMVLPAMQGHGIGTALYAARQELTQRLGLLRIRATARIRGYSRYSGRMSAEEYVREVVHGRIKDPTLSFQLRHGFEVLAVVSGYLLNDHESLGYGALIEWINPEVAKPEDYAHRDPRFLSALVQKPRPPETQPL
jgi:GNAT superfamily N-acetyltransferase